MTFILAIGYDGKDILRLLKLPFPRFRNHLLTIYCSYFTQIVKAYRKNALKYHPDKNSDPAAVDIFHKLSKALEVLTDSAARVRYNKNG